MQRKAFGFLTILLVASVAGCPAHVEHDEKKSDTRLELCKDLLHKHQLDAAKTECDKAIAYKPTNDSAYLARGLISFSRVIDTEQTLEIDGCLTGLDAEATHKDLDKYLHDADRDFEEAVRIAPEYGEAWADRGVVHNLLEDYATAEQYLKQALQFPARLENTPITRAHLGWALFNENNGVDAAKELRTALQFQPKMCVATYRLGRVYFARGEWDKAAEYLQTASDDAACRLQEASLYLMKTKLQQGLVNDARDARDACLKLSPKSCVALQCKAEGGALGPSAAPPLPAAGKATP